MYRAARVGGDFYDFLVTASGRLVFLLLEVAGKREQALDIAAAVQDHMRPLASEALRDHDVNEAVALPKLMIELNRVILRAASGVGSAPGGGGG